MKQQKMIEWIISHESHETYDLQRDPFTFTLVETVKKKEKQNLVWGFFPIEVKVVEPVL